MAAYQVGLLVEKMSSPDKDFRFMAINDLMKDLVSGTLSLEEDASAKVIRALIRLLNDSNGEVQNLAIKCCGILAQPSRIKHHHLEFAIEELTPFLFNKCEAARDVHALTIKAIIQNLAPSSANNSSAGIVKKLLPKLTDALRTRQLDDAAKIDIIDIIGDLLLRFGDTVPELHDSVHDVILLQLNSSRQSIRKKSTSAFGYLAAVATPVLYDRIVAGLLDKLGNAKGAENCRTFIVAITFVAKSSGAKFSDHLSKVVPYLIQFLRSSDDDDLKEAALQGLEVFLYRCPTEVAAFQTDVQQVLSTNLSYDPNYEYGDEDDDDEMDCEDDDEEYSDDEDMTWKVRRATAKAIEAMIISKRESFLLYISTLGPLLISRFREREETVRNEVLSAYIALLNQFSIIIPRSAITLPSETESMQIDDVSTNISTVSLSPEQNQIVKALADQKDRLLKSVTRIIKKHIKSGSKCLELLTSLVKCYPGALDSYLSDLIPSVSKILIDKQATAQGKMIVLNFISKAIAQHDSKVFEQHLDSLTNIVTFAIEDQFYKISAEGLILSGKYAEVLRDCGNGENVATNVEKLFDTVNRKFVANDTDQDVRERSISSISHIVALFRQEFGGKIQGVLEKLTERVGREMTCLVAIRAFSEIISVGISIDQNLLKTLLGHIVEYLKKISRSLRIASLIFIQNLLNSAIEGILEIPNMEMSQVLGELPNLLNDADLQITNQTLGCLSTAFASFPHTVEMHLDLILEAIVKMIQSSLIQGAALNSLMSLFSNIVKGNLENQPTFVKLLDTVTSPVYDVPNLTRQSHHAISSVASTIAETTNDLEKSRALAQKLAEQLIDTRSTDSIRLFAMSTIGELGRRCPQVFVDSAIR
ncbi:unnamed protein product [Caenorhabditis angaria]|uniref:TATA-binding protein interacting (TIP20) domain-containing protein n=1 Tax=Caenorhabditis angaria TaxID=860376 RepID=A0A9P1IVR4_9PELO|nr:unnamed protein product [Caenorhabditis angaria]